MRKPKQRVGRQPSLEKDRQLTAQICALLAEGVSIQAAMNLSGICERAYHDWMRRGHLGEEPYFSFLSAASRARDSWKATLVNKVRQADDWRAAAFLLERQFPAEFGSKVVADVAPLAAPVVHVTIQRDKATDEARKRFGTPPPNRLRTRTL
ncbi:MAG: hypothetical protein H0W20_00450 [Chthoniobacterales bacterium]|nr:hypothetical protein [Chthoniobacterales bacterium]